MQAKTRYYGVPVFYYKGQYIVFMQDCMYLFEFIQDAYSFIEMMLYADLR